MGMNEKAQSKGSIPDGVQVLRSSSTDYRPSQPLSRHQSRRRSADGWKTGISGFIVMSAAISVVPIYSLMALLTGGILMGAVYGDRVHEVEKDWRIRTAFRLLASTPPAFGSLLLQRRAAAVIGSE